MKHEIEIEGLPEGWEPVAFRPCADDEWFVGPTGRPEQLNNGPRVSRLIIRRKVRKYDWGRTLDDVLVNIDGESGYHSLRTSKCVPSPREGIADIWQANIHGKCPVDPDASLVELSLSDGTIRKGRASDFGWAISSDEWHAAIIGWRFIGLADGYEW